MQLICNKNGLLLHNDTERVVLRGRCFESDLGATRNDKQGSFYSF